MSLSEVEILVVGLVALAAMTMRWYARQGSRRAAPPAVDLQRLEERLARIEQAIDTMAIETERISEAQRFAAKLLHERAPARKEDG